MVTRPVEMMMRHYRSFSGRVDNVPYPDYKDSGVEWLGGIPAHWGVTAAKRQFTIQLGKMLQKRPASQHDIEVPYLKARHVQWFAVDASFLPTMWMHEKESEKYHVQKGDLVVCEGGEGGRCGIVQDVPRNCIIQNALHRVREDQSRESRVEYLQYVIRAVASAKWFDVINSKATIAHFTKDKFDELLIPVPPHTEQQAIATFLDRETEQIDTLIEKQEQLINLLQENRIVLISHAVTKGLDTNVPMKDSGVEWLGEIPAHWEVKQLGQIGTFRKCNGGTKEDESPDGLPCVRYGDLYTHHNSFVRQCCSYISSESAINYTLIQYGDILFAGSGETLDEIAKSAVNLIDTEVYCGGDVILLRLNIEADAHFMGYVASTPQAAYQKALMGRGITVMHIYGSQLKYLSVAVPPIEEQQAIASFLDRETEKIDSLISKIHRVIELQKESRAALITEAVTGKIDVR